MKKKDFLWVEKYRPQTIEECILPSNTKAIFKAFLEQGEIPHLLLSGSAGIGKTTVARALCEELGATVMEINGSDEGRLIDTLRSKITQFATTLDLTNRAPHKVVIIDEADNTSEAVQMALRHSMEAFSGNCRFILTCNFPNRINDPIHSRCTVIDFSINSEEKQKLQFEFFSRLEQILTERGIEYDRKVLVKVVQKFYPDWRRLLNEVQKFTSTGELSPSVLVDIADVSTETLVDAMKTKNYTVVLRWVADNIDSEPGALWRTMFFSLKPFMPKKCIPELSIILARYGQNIKDVADPQINLQACLAEIMYSCEFK